MSYPCFRMHKTEVYRMGLDVVSITSGDDDAKLCVLNMCRVVSTRHMCKLIRHPARSCQGAFAFHPILTGKRGIDFPADPPLSCASLADAVRYSVLLCCMLHMCCCR
jgi:hypothetical protein